MSNIRLLYPSEDLLPGPVRKAILEFFHNRWPMRYHLVRKAGHPVGSCTVESARRHVVQQRLKQSGLRCSRLEAQAMIALRSTLLNQPNLNHLQLSGLA